LPVTTTLYACPKKKPAICDSIPKLMIDWDKVDKEEYKKSKGRIRGLQISQNENTVRSGTIYYPLYK
jgi:hypothetical protein